MASKQMLLVLVLVVVVVATAVLPGITLAKEFMVGDDSGWTTGFDYQAWAKDKTFKTGDKLVFMYPKGAHSVQKVNGTGFEDCTKPPANEALATGNDVITLATPGKKWYICGVGKHCVGGQKFSITVTGKALDSASNSPHGITISWIQVLMAAIITTGMMVIAM